METETRMKIVRFEASNIMRLKAVEIDAAGQPVITITGDNGNGKSSIMNAISFALGGKDAIPEMPMRTGTSKAHVVVDLGDIVVTRKFSASGGSTLTVAAKDGMPVKSPQGLLDSLYNKVAYDPLSFVRMAPDKQVEQLRKLVGLDFSKLDAERKRVYDERTLSNRELSVAKAKLAGYKFDSSVPTEEVSVINLMAQLNKAQADAQESVRAIRAAWQQKENAARSNNAHNETERQKLTDLRKQWATQENEMSNLREEISEIKKLLAQKEEELTAIVANIEPLRNVIEMKDAVVKGLVDAVIPTIQQQAAEAEKLAENEALAALRPIQDAIENADRINRQVAANARYVELKKEVDAAEAKVEKQTERITAIDKEKADSLTKAKFPLPTLSFNDSGVLLDGVPFSQGSAAEQIRAAVAIGLALNPRIPVILVRDASLLDAKSLAMVEEMAIKCDAQVWIEKIQDTRPGAIIIEDGMVKGVVE